MADLVHSPNFGSRCFPLTLQAKAEGRRAGLQKPRVPLQGSPTHLCKSLSALVVPSPVLSAVSPGWGGLLGLFSLAAVATACASGDQRGRRPGRGRQEESGQRRAASVSLSIPAGLRLRTPRAVTAGG